MLLWPDGGRGGVLPLLLWLEYYHSRVVCDLICSMCARGGGCVPVRSWLFLRVLQERDRKSVV